MAPIPFSLDYTVLGSTEEEAWRFRAEEERMLVGSKVRLCVDCKSHTTLRCGFSEPALFLPPILLVRKPRHTA